MRNIKKRLGVWALVVAAILMVPLLARAPWTAGDFVFGAVVLFGAAATYEVVTRNMAKYEHRVAAGFIVFIILAIVWVGAATGFEGIIDRLG